MKIDIWAIRTGMSAAVFILVFVIEGALAYWPDSFFAAFTTTFAYLLMSIYFERSS